MHYTGRGELDADAGEADEQRRQAEPAGEDSLVLDAVLEREHDDLRTNHRSERTSRRRGVVRLDAHQHQIGHGRLGGIAHGADAAEPERLARELDGETVTPERLQVRAPRNQGDVVPAPGEPGAEVATDGAGAEDEHAHGDATSRDRWLRACRSSPWAPAEPRPAR